MAPRELNLASISTGRIKYQRSRCKIYSPCDCHLRFFVFAPTITRPSNINRLILRLRTTTHITIDRSAIFHTILTNLDCHHHGNYDRNRLNQRNRPIRLWLAASSTRMNVGIGRAYINHHAYSASPFSSSEVLTRILV